MVLVELAAMAGLVVVPLATEATAGAGVFDGLVEELEVIDELPAVKSAEIVEFDMIAPASESMI